jgi:hypothetical protein
MPFALSVAQLKINHFCVAHQLDLIGANPDNLHASCAFERSTRLFACAKKFWRLQPSAGSKSLRFPRFGGRRIWAQQNDQEWKDQYH